MIAVPGSPRVMKCAEHAINKPSNTHRASQGSRDWRDDHVRGDIREALGCHAPLFSL